MTKKLPKFDNARVIIKKYGPVEGFVVNTHKGIIRKSNEDRVSILLNAQKKFKKYQDKTGPIISSSMFSIFDGHGGISCSNFLKQNLHNKILEHFEMEGPIIPTV